MAEFDPAFDFMIPHEGDRFTDDPLDNGGATKYGITLNFLQGLHNDDWDLDGNGTIGKEDVKLLTLSEAKSIYQTEWWERYGYESIDSQRLANKVFDTAVNVGGKRANKFLQEVLNSFPNIDIGIDGGIGEETIEAINRVNESELVKGYKDRLSYFYRAIVSAHPSQARFQKGWERRAQEG